MWNYEGIEMDLMVAMLSLQIVAIIMLIGILL